jgi:ankyrin repeat protein
MTPTDEPTNTIKELNLRDMCVWPAHIAVDTRNIEALRTIHKEDLLFTDSDGETALHYAAVNDDLEICKILINLNIDIVNIKDVENKTAYDWACEYNNEYNSHIEICEFLKKFA